LAVRANMGKQCRLVVHQRIDSPLVTSDINTVASFCRQYLMHDS
jgi:hypothetical protein